MLSGSIRGKVEFIPAASSCPSTASIFLDLGRSYGSELDSTPHAVNERFLQSILERQGERDRWLLLLKCDEDYIGFVHAKIDRDDHPGWGYILEFYIVPDRRRSGWGRKLFYHTVGIFKSRGITQIWLTSNRNAQAFWCSLGFKATDQEEQGQMVIVV